MLAVVIVLGGMLNACGSDTDNSIVGTSNGRVQGILTHNHLAFLGIPFAAPPIGDLRWKAPQPAANWSGVRRATSFGHICSQSTGSQSSADPNQSPSEDCLYLNIYVPRDAGQDPLPVMVWYYGGGFTAGAGSLYDGSVIAKKGNVIVVTTNYRLGVFGFLVTTGLSAENPSGASGNYGFMDQQAALRWVQTNIRPFGGDPNNVTIFGESAGGASVCAQMTSPLAVGLFHKAIAESNCDNLLFAPLAQAQTTALALVSLVGCTNSDPAVVVSCLRALPAESLLQGYKATASVAVSLNPLGQPIIDGLVLPQAIKSSFQAGAFSKVPLLVGTNHDEGRLVIASSYDIPNGYAETTAQYTDWVNSIFSVIAPQVLALYPISNYGGKANEAHSAVLTDVGFACPQRTESQILASQIPVYAYEFNDPNAPTLDDPFMPLLATHGSELLYVFQAPIGQQQTGAAVNLSESQLALSNQIIKYWTTFARTGTPNSPGSPTWLPYSSLTDQFQLLQPDTEGPVGPESNFASFHQCAFWGLLGQ